MTSNRITIRETVLGRVTDYAAEASIREHERGHHRLYVLPDGTIYWSEETDANSWQQIRNTSTPVATIVKYDLTIPCNCEACQRGEDPREWAGSSDDIGYTRDAMEQSVAEIAQGYFDDETENE